MKPDDQVYYDDIVKLNSSSMVATILVLNTALQFHFDDKYEDETTARVKDAVALIIECLQASGMTRDEFQAAQESLVNQWTMLFALEGKKIDRGE